MAVDLLIRFIIRFLIWGYGFMEVRQRKSWEKQPRIKKKITMKWLLYPTAATKKNMGQSTKAKENHKHKLKAAEEDAREEKELTHWFIIQHYVVANQRCLIRKEKYVVTSVKQKFGVYLLYWNNLFSSYFAVLFLKKNFHEWSNLEIISQVDQKPVQAG